MFEPVNKEENLIRGKRAKTHVEKMNGYIPTPTYASHQCRVHSAYNPSKRVCQVDVVNARSKWL